MSSSILGRRRASFPWLRGTKPSHVWQPQHLYHTSGWSGVSVSDAVYGLRRQKHLRLKDLRGILDSVFVRFAKMPEANYLRSVSWGYIKVWMLDSSELCVSTVLWWTSRSVEVVQSENDNKMWPSLCFLHWPGLCELCLVMCGKPHVNIMKTSVVNECFMSRMYIWTYV